MRLTLNKTAAAGLLTALALGLPCAAWYVAGSREAEREAEAAAGEPVRRAVDAAARLAVQLALRLEALVDAESRRPFYHYQNLYHDPKGASEGASVVPSPLAEGPADPFVRAYFQVDPSGRLTMPTLNEDVPELNRPAEAAGQRAIQRELTPAALTCVQALRQPQTARITAPIPGASPSVAASSMKSLRRRDPADAGNTQYTVLNQQAWQLNSTSNEAYQQIQGRNGNVGVPGNVGDNRGFDLLDAAEQAGGAYAPPPPPLGQVDDPSLSREPSIAKEFALQRSPAEGGGARVLAPTQQSSSPVFGSNGARQDDPAQKGNAGTVNFGNVVGSILSSQVGRADKQGNVVIPVGPFQWRTVPIAGVPTLVALRDVKVPTGALTQGFAVSAAAVGDWLRSLGLPVSFQPGPPAREGDAWVPIDGAVWRVSVDPGAAAGMAMARARQVLVQFARTFLIGASAALLAGLCVVGLVWQSERLARRRSQFAASAAHELRTPLAGLRMYGEMLAEGLGDPAKSRDYARRVAGEAERLGRVVGNVLNFTRLERGALGIRPEPGDLGAIVRECVDRQRPALEAMGARVEAAIPDGLPTARFDRDALGQILANLLDNAEKYSRAAADRTIRVALIAPGTSDDDRDRGRDTACCVPTAAIGNSDEICITVTDRGPGIPASVRARLFRPFERGSDADAPAGLGLGLAIAQALARAQGGDLTCADAEGGGTVFTVTVPGKL